MRAECQVWLRPALPAASLMTTVGSLARSLVPCTVKVMALVRRARRALLAPSVLIIGRVQLGQVKGLNGGPRALGPLLPLLRAATLMEVAALEDHLVEVVVLAAVEGGGSGLVVVVAVVRPQLRLPMDRLEWVALEVSEVVVVRRPLPRLPVEVEPVLVPLCRQEAILGLVG